MSLFVRAFLTDKVQDVFVNLSFSNFVLSLRRMEDDSEQDRRRIQRETQALVLRLRKEGVPESEIEMMKKRMRAQRRNQAREKAMKRKWKEAFDDEDSSIDLVIVPILWRNRSKEAKMISSRCEELRDVLEKRGIKVWIDFRQSLLPGQKFERWETAGVHLRCEIGPNELEGGQVVITKSATDRSDNKAPKRKTEKSPVPFSSAENEDEVLTILKILHEKGLEIAKEIPVKKSKRGKEESTGDSLEANYFLEN